MTYTVVCEVSRSWNPFDAAGVLFIKISKKKMVIKVFNLNNYSSKGCKV